MREEIKQLTKAKISQNIWIERYITLVFSVLFLFGTALSVAGTERETVEKTNEIGEKITNVRTIPTIWTYIGGSIGVIAIIVLRFVLWGCGRGRPGLIQLEKARIQREKDALVAMIQ